MLPTGGECVYILYSRERRKSESNPTHNGPEGGRKENQVGGERERGDLLLFYDGYGDGSSWRRNETVVQVNCSYCKVHGPVK